MVRVIAGRFRSRRLKTLPGSRTRPTSDQLRETLFNILGQQIEGATFADLYAGSGAVGIEAISRGAAKAYFVESNPKATQVVIANLKTLEIVYNTEAEVVALGVGRALRKFSNRGIQFDLVFLDPPYDSTDEYTLTLHWLGAGNLLTGDALVIAEHDKRHGLATSYGGLNCVRELTQGDSTLSLFAIQR